MDSKRAKLFVRLEALGIASTTVEHAPVFTVDESQGLRGTIPGAHTKSLFLKDKDGRMALVVAKEDTKVDLKGLAKRLGFGRFSFGKPELMESVLGVEPGSVTAFALVNETSRHLAANGATLLAEATLTPWQDLNARLEAPGGLQLTLFSEAPNVPHAD